MSEQLEEILRDSFCEYRRGTTNIIAIKEVPVFTRSVDLVEYNKKTDELTAIEFKISDWKRALNQLKKVDTCFDYLVLCVPRPKTGKCREKIEIECAARGVGLYYWFNNSFCHVCVEKNTREIWNIQKHHIIEYLLGKEAQNE